MHYFHTHFNVYPNPQGKVHRSDNKASPNVTSGKLRVIKHVDQETSGREDVQKQIGAYEPGARPNVGQTEQHSQGDHKVQAILKVSPLVAPIQGLAVTHPKYTVVRQVSNIPEQQQRAVVVVDENVPVRLKELFHYITHNIIT